MALPWITSVYDPTNGEQTTSTLSRETFAERLKVTLDQELKHTTS
ncbi:hypothetical protein SAMN04489740_2552 [Arthrobacter alpinus]|uniref:Uncharacterized protein n=1 Tax=Arthrobacter alpinus TaxID=656366 RepID=A0A1H5LRX0_9MICC|nr:hypothetical protein SAMN04489740_2552 [Arthrobacter alpinus]